MVHGVCVESHRFVRAQTVGKKEGIKKKFFLKIEIPNVLAETWEKFSRVQACPGFSCRESPPPFTLLKENF